MDFGRQAPEINSGRMHSGPGSESLLQAADAWDRLAANLSETVAYCREATATLAEEWKGAAAIAMRDAATPYLRWLALTATQAEQAATRASAAASAHESAFAALVHPDHISANRAHRLSLSATNCLGQTSPAIAEIDAAYEQMWTTNANAMYAYARASAEAAVLTPFTPPPGGTPVSTAQGGASCPPSRAWALRVGPEIISAGCQVIATIPDALRALCRSPLASFDVTLSPITASLSRLASLSAPSDFAIFYLNGLNKAAALACLSPGPGSAGDCAAALGRGKPLGRLTVPPIWITETAAPAAEPLPRGWVCEPIHLVHVADPQLARPAGGWHTTTTEHGD
ncbi:PPE family protein [Mycobacterium sp. TY815]|uniref:PPE family protein n=1 Tax=Mycobacterium sp. TY815 TaxID=3050581 RepID=UPI0027409C54|nr:PPE family protein [Mycobacterium sp. TY815]MDP7703520.1 PPE family protein [Mycobacterium sp. TY815]